MPVTPSDLRLQAHHAEQMAERVASTSERARLLRFAAQLRFKATELERRKVSRPPDV
jgi:hypothetical protein